MPVSFCFFFFNDTATTEIYPLSLHDALPILLDELLGDEEAHVSFPSSSARRAAPRSRRSRWAARPRAPPARPDRKSTRLNSSHSQISYAVSCLKKKKTPQHQPRRISTLIHAT